MRKMTREDFELIVKSKKQCEAMDFTLDNCDCGNCKFRKKCWSNYNKFQLAEMIVEIGRVWR